MKRGRLFSLGVALLALGAIALAAMRITQAQAPVPPAVPPTTVKSADAAPAADAAPTALPASGSGADVLFAPAPPSADNLQFFLRLGGGPGTPPVPASPADLVLPGVGRATISVPAYGPHPISVPAYGPHPAGAMNSYEALLVGFTADPELAQLENDVVNLARQAKGVPADEALRNQLKAALEKAFDRRLALQAEEATALRERLAKVESAIDKRKSLREKIVELRLQQLVTDPELEWDATLGRVSPAVPPTPYYVPTPTLPGNAIVPPAPAKSPFKLLAPKWTPRAANVPNYPSSSDTTPEQAPGDAWPLSAPSSTSPEGRGFSRLDGAGTTALRAGLDQVGTLRDRLEDLREQIDRAGMRKEFAQQRATERRLSSTLADIKKQVRLWELELESAKISLALAANEVTAIEVANSKSRGTYTPVEVDRKRLAADQVKIRVRQVQEILGAYQELLSNATASAAEKTTEPAAADQPATAPARP